MAVDYSANPISASRISEKGIVMGMAPWVELDQGELNQPVQTRIRGADVEVMVSPQDFPIAARGYLSDSGELFIIEFKYVADEDEPLVTAIDMHRVAFIVGQKSRRLRKIAIKVDGNTPQGAVKDAANALGDAVEFLISTSPRRRGNYRATQEILARKSEQLANASF